ncbi:MAG TPA: hypothetical protein VJQ25_03810, partial [Nitrospira sp.]|nr:hypothetical protein [Nitrospira sp.]
MIPFLSQMQPEEFTKQLIEMNRKVIKGIESLGRIRDEDFQVGVTPKEEICREDNVVLYRFTPLVE